MIMAIIKMGTATVIGKNRNGRGENSKSSNAAMPARVTTRATGDAIAIKTAMMASTVTTASMATTANTATMVATVTHVATDTTLAMATTVAMAITAATI